MVRSTLAFLLSVIVAEAPLAQVAESMVPPPGRTPVVVNTGFELIDVNEVDEGSETFEFEGVLSLNWLDPRLAFDPESVGSDELVYKGDYQFAEIFDGWWPQVLLSNQSRIMSRQGVVLRIQPDGTVWYVEEIDAVAESSMDLRRFPFDRQVLEARFRLLGYGSDEVVLRATREPSGQLPEDGDSIRSAEWRVGDVAVETMEGPVVVAGAAGVAKGSVLKVSIVAVREPGSVLRGIVAPLMLFVVLSWSVFWMDSESLGDRMDISFIGLLTVVAFQLIVEGDLPDIPYLTVMGAFLLSNYLLLAASIVVNLRVGYLVRSGRRHEGDLIDRRCRWVFPLLYFVLVPAALLVFGVAG